MAIKKQSIMDAIATRMALILKVSGYHSDLGKNVIESRPQLVDAGGAIGHAPVEPSECPCVLIRDPTDTITVIDLSGGEEHLLSVELEIRNEGGSTTDSDLREMEQDVRSAIGVDTRWSDLAMSTVMASSNKALYQADKIVGVVLIRLNVTYTTSAFGEN